MNTNLPTLCYNCSTPLPSIGYFCGACLVQFKCKSCETILEKDYVGCVNCGTPKLNAERSSTSQKNINTFRLHETATDRTIEATFSDDVAKDIAGTLRDAAANNRIKATTSNTLAAINFSEKTENTIQLTDAEIIQNEHELPAAEVIQTSIVTGNTLKSDKYPAMKYLVMNKLPSSEVEWIIVYAFYSSNFGERTFTRKDIMTQYEESGRKTAQRTKNLTGSITNAVKGKYINPINDEDFSIMNLGIEKIEEIISRSNGSTTTNKTSRIKKENKNNNVNNKKSKKLSNLEYLTDFNFKPSNNKSLKDFYNEFSPKNNYEKNLIFVYYLQEIQKISIITTNHIYSCYRELGLKIPSLPQSLIDTSANKGYISTSNTNDLKVTRTGMNYIEHDIERNNE